MAVATLLRRRRLAAVGVAEFTAWWKTPKLVRGAVYSPEADHDTAVHHFASAYALPVTYDTFASTHSTSGADGDDCGGCSTPSRAGVRFLGGGAEEQLLIVHTGL